MGKLFFRPAVLCGLLAGPIPAFQQTQAVSFLRAAHPSTENEQLLRLEALSEADSAAAAGFADDLGQITGTRLECLSRKLLIKKKLGIAYGQELYLMGLWFQKHQGHDGIYRTNSRDLAHYSLALASLGSNADAAISQLAGLQNGDGSWSEKPGKPGGPGLTALAARALRNSPSALVHRERILKAMQWLSPGFSSRLTSQKGDLLYLLRSGNLILAEESYRGQFDALWSHVEKQQGSDGSLLSDVELTALAVLLRHRLPGNVELSGLSLQNQAGRPLASALAGQPLRLDARFLARHADFSGGLRVHLDIQAGGVDPVLQVDTVLSATLAKGATRAFLISLGDLDSAGTYRLGGSFAYAAGADSVRTSLAGFYFRVERQADLRFTGDSLRVSPDSAQAGDTVAIRARFLNAGQTFSGPFQVACLVRPQNGGYDTLGIHIFPKAVIGVPLEFSFLSSFPAGDYQAKLILDPDNRIAESDEGNDTLVRNFSIGNLPDLAFRGGMQATCVKSGDSSLCRAVAILVNKGKDSAGAFVLRLGLSVNQVPQSGSDSTFQGLAADSALPVTLNFTIADTLSAAVSSFLVSLILDPSNLIPESEERNNKTEKSLKYASGLNYLVQENSEEPPPIFIVPGFSVREHLTILAQNLTDSSTVPVRALVLRDSLDTLMRLDTSLSFPAGSSSSSFSISWMPKDSSGQFLVKVTADPANAAAESNESDNFLSIKRFTTGFQSRVLAGPALVDSSGNVTLKVQVKDFLGKPVPGLDKGRFSLSNRGVVSRSFAVVPLQNPQVEKNRIDVVIMDSHEPAALYRTRKLYYEMMPELRNEFARMGFSLNFAFRTPYFKERTDEGAVRGDFPQGIFNGQIRNLLDEADHTYKWAPAATYLATYFPWRENSLRVIVPMFDYLGQGEEFNRQDPVVGNRDDSSRYHLEFADSCLNRGIEPFMLVNNWGYSELRVGQVNAIAARTGGSVHFPGTRDRMKAELRQFIAQRIANYEIQGDAGTLGFPLAEEDRLGVGLEYRRGLATDTTAVVMPKALALDVQLSLARAEARNDTLVADILLRNRSGVFLGAVDVEVRESRNGAPVSRFVLSQGSLRPLSQSQVTLRIPMAADSLRYVFTAQGAFRDAAPGNNSDSALVYCPRCRHPDLSLHSDSLPGAQIRTAETFLAQFQLPWRDNLGGQVEISIADAEGRPLYRAEAASAAGFNQTQINLNSPASLAGAPLTVRVAYLDQPDRNLLDNVREYTLRLPSGPLSAFFRDVPALARTGGLALTSHVDLASERVQAVDTALTILARNVLDPSLVSILDSAGSVHVEPTAHADREFHLDITLKDSLSGLRYGQYLFNPQGVAAALHLPAGARVNAGSFKVVQITGAEAGKVYPLNVRPMRSGQELTGYRIQWPMGGPHFDSSATHRLYFSFDAHKVFADVDFIGDDVYTLNNFGDLHHLRAAGGEPSAPVFLQNFPGSDSLRYMRMGAGDFNEDGFDDIVYTDKHQLLMRPGAANATFGSAQTLKSAWTYSFGFPYAALAISEPKVGDFNGDGHLDIAVGPVGFANYEILFGDGAGHFTAGSWGAGFYGHGSPGDVFRPSASAKDFLAQSTGTSMDVWSSPEGWSANGQTALFGYGGQGLSGTFSSTASNGLTVSDMNNDGKEDMVSDFIYNDWNLDPGHTQDDFTARYEVPPPSVVYWLGTGSGVFTPRLAAAEQNKVYGFMPTVSGWSEIGSMDNIDFNGDGHEDLILTESSVPYRTLAYAGRGNFAFDPPIVLGYDSVGVWGMQVAYKRTVRATAGNPAVNRPAGNVLPVTWNPATVGPGEYVMEAWVKHAPGDSERIGISPSFRILPALQVAASVAPARPSFRAGLDFTGALVLENRDSIFPVSEFTARVTARSAGDTSLVFNQGGLSIGPASDIRFPLRFTAESGQSLLIVLTQQGSTDTTVYSVPVTSGQALVTGTLRLGDYEGVDFFRTGRSLSLQMTAANAGNAAAATRLLLLLRNLSGSNYDTLHDESVTLNAAASLTRSVAHAFSSSGDFRAVWLSTGTSDTVTLDSKLIHVTGSAAPQIVRVSPPSGSVVSAGNLIDIWVDTLSALSNVTVTQQAVNRAAVFRKDSLGYKLFRDTILAQTASLLAVSISAQDVSSHNGATAVDDANPAQITYLYSDTVQPFLVSGVEDGAIYAADLLISARANANLIRFPSILLDSQAFAGGPVAGEGDHDLLLTGILADNRPYQRHIRFAIDKTAPVIEVDNLADGDVLDHSVLPIIRAFDPHGTTLRVYLDGNAWNEGAVGQGSHILLVTAADSVGNRGTLAMRFSVDMGAGKFVKFNPPLPGSHHSRTVFPEVETNVDDVLDEVIGFARTASFDSSALAGLADSLKTAGVKDWTAGALTTASWWKKTSSPDFNGFGPDGHQYVNGVQQSVLASWASESAGADRSPETAFPDSMVAVSNDSGLFILNSATLAPWMRFRIDYSANNNRPIHRPLFHLKFMDGWLFGFWNSGLFAVSLVEDKIYGWNTSLNARQYRRWNGLSTRNSGTPETVFLQNFSFAELHFQDFGAIIPHVARYQGLTLVQLYSPESFLSIALCPGFADQHSSGSPGQKALFAHSSGRDYRLRIANSILTLDTLVINSGGGSSRYLSFSGFTAHLPGEYAQLTPDLDINDIFKSQGTTPALGHVRNINALSGDFYQSTWFNALDSTQSPGRSIIRVGRPPGLWLKENGGFNDADWTVTQGQAALRGGMIKPDSAFAPADSIQLNIAANRKLVGDFEVELTATDAKAADTNSYVRISFTDTSGAERITAYLGAHAFTTEFFGSTYAIRPRAVTGGYEVRASSESQATVATQPLHPVTYRIRITKTLDNFRLSFWDLDKWTDVGQATGFRVKKRSLKMQVAVVTRRGKSGFSLRLDRFVENRTHYPFPAEVARLADAVPAGNKVAFTAILQNGSRQIFIMDSASHRIQGRGPALPNDTLHNTLALNPGKILSADGSGFSLRAGVTGDDILPADSVSEEGSHQLIAKVTSRKYGVLADTSAFIIDKSRPSVQITNVSAGQIFHQPVTVQYSIQDAHLDSFRTEVLLNGLAYGGGPVAGPGDFEFRIKALDLAGNLKDTTVAFTVTRQLRRTFAQRTLTLHEDVSDSSLEVGGLFEPPSGVAFTVFPAADLGLGLTGSHRLFVQPAQDFSGIRDVVIQAGFDGADIFDTLRVTVLPVNDPPVLLSSDSITGPGNQPVGYQVVLGDADDVPTFQAVGLPAWLGRNGDLLAGTPPVSGSQTQFTLSLSDGDTTVNRTIHVNIQNVNQPPVIAPEVVLEPAAAAQDIHVNLAAHAADPDHAPSQLTWSWSGSSHVTVVPGANKDLFTLVPASGFHDTVTLRLTLTDPGNLSVYQDVFLDWTLDNGPVHTFLKHWFPFREGTGTTSRDSLSDRVFTLPSTAMWSPDTGLAFRAVTGAPATASTALHPRRGLSFEFWLKSDSLVSSTVNLVGFTRTAAPHTTAWALRLHNRELRVVQSDGADSSTAVFSGALAHANLWHHFVASLGRDSVALYRNGILLGKVGHPGLDEDSISVTPFLGGAESVGGNPAGIALLRVYERPFSAFKAAHNFGKAEKQRGLTAVVEAEDFTRRVGSYFPFLALPALPSDTAMGADDSTAEECLLVPADSSFVEFTVSIPQSGVYSLFGRALGKVYDNSFWVQVDGEAPVEWHTSFENRWRTEWVKGPVAALPDQWSLTAGSHTFRIHTREMGVRLDWIGLSTRDDLLLRFVENPARFPGP